MFNNIKFSATVVPKDHNGNDLEIGDFVIVKSQSFYGQICRWRIIGITNDEKYLWLGDGDYMRRRMPKNVIKVTNPQKFFEND